MNIAATPNVPSPNSPSTNASQFMMAGSNFSTANNQANIQNTSIFNANTSTFNNAVNLPMATSSLSSSPPPPSSPSQTYGHQSPVSPPPSTLSSPGYLNFLILVRKFFISRIFTRFELLINGDCEKYDSNSFYIQSLI